ncbi:cytochrome P450 CYP72A219-like [Tripterygium wilfordii]|uniref:cytochrome P450 CYP72A219-like n=1 Tax=Tripterygium wilfordii TaxID=458696 RepID=UPI0018F80DB0|nr:cytochrome P450 CYP72A219-like [Tripterygium wilfordii]
MIPGFSISCNLMIERWKKMTSDNETGELDIWPELQKLTADIILRAAFGSSYEEGKKMSGLQKELITLVIEAMQTIYIPGFRFLPTKNNPKRNKLVKEITSIMKDLIQRRQNAIRSEQSKVDDILSLLLQRTEENSMTQNTNGTKSAEITIEEVIEECKQFYLAGQETTTSLITWTIIILCMHPDWQQRAREEVLQVCGKKDPDFEAISHLKTISCPFFTSFY